MSPCMLYVRLCFRSRSRRSLQKPVLEPALSSSTAILGSSLTATQPSPFWTASDPETMLLDFGQITNAPDNQQTGGDMISGRLSFRVADDPEALSGRVYPLEMQAVFTGGQQSTQTPIKVVGPLLKPELSITKTFKVCKSYRRSYQ